jgi:hypothetical protein
VTPSISAKDFQTFGDCPCWRCACAQDDGWSEENMRRWEKEDVLDPQLAGWLKAQREAKD